MKIELSDNQLKWKQFNHFKECEEISFNKIELLLNEIMKNKKKLSTVVEPLKNTLQKEVLENEYYVFNTLTNLKNKSLQYVVDLSYMLQGGYQLEDENYQKLIAKDPYVLMFASVKIKKDKEQVKKIIENHGYLIKHINNSLKNDLDICIAAIKNNGINYIVLSDEMKKNETIIKEALKQNQNIFNALSNDLKNNKDIVFECLNYNNAIMFWKEINDELRSQEDVLERFLLTNGNIYKYLSESERNDFKNIENAIKGEGFSMVKHIPENHVQDNYNASLIIDLILEKGWLEKKSPFNNYQKEILFIENKDVSKIFNNFLDNTKRLDDMELLYKTISTKLKELCMYSDINNTTPLKKIKKTKF